MTLHAEPINDWACPFPFTIARLDSEHDAELGQWCVTIALLGIGVALTWVYDETTPLRAKLAGMMADETWLDSSMASMPFAEYKALKENADIGRAYLRWYAAAKGYANLLTPDKLNEVVLAEADKWRESQK